MAIRPWKIIWPLAKRLIDGRRWRDYSVKLLHEWKERAESPGQRALASLGPLSEERLEELLIAAMEVRDKKILRALEELKHIDLEAAHLLNQVLVEVRELRSSGPIIDPDTARALADAGRSLRHIDADLPNQLQNAAAAIKSALPDM